MRRSASENHRVRHVAGFAVVLRQLSFTRVATGQNLPIIEQKHQALLRTPAVRRNVHHLALRDAHQFHAAAVGRVPQAKTAVAVIAPGVNGAVLHQCRAIVVGRGAAMNRLNHGAPHRHLIPVAARAAIGVAPVATIAAGPQGLVRLLEIGDRVVVAAGIDLHHIGGHLHRGVLVSRVAIAQLPVVVDAPGVQGTGAVQGEGMHVGAEHLDDDFAGKAATGTRHGDVGLVGRAIAQLAVAVVAPRIQGAVVLDRVVSGVALPACGNLRDAGEHRQLHKVVALIGVTQAELTITVVTAGVDRAIATQHQGAVVTLAAAVERQIHDRLTGDRIAGIGAHVDRHGLIGRVAGAQLTVPVVAPAPQLTVLVDAVAVGVLAVIEFQSSRKPGRKRGARWVGTRIGGPVAQLPVGIAPPGADAAVGHDEAELAIAVGLRALGVLRQFQYLGARAHIGFRPDWNALRAHGQHLPGLADGQGHQLVAVEIDDFPRQTRHPLRALRKQIPGRGVSVRRHTRSGIDQTDKAVAVVSHYILAGIGGAGIKRATPSEGNLAQRNGSHGTLLQETGK